jgi:transcriptional regulator NrdR family protein
MVMERLKDLDEVAYIRFASVYWEFMDLQQVKKEIDKVLSSRTNSRAGGAEKGIPPRKGEGIRPR